MAYRADNGERLWDFPTQTGVVAPPMTYAIDGEQYISVNVGWGGAYALVFGEFVTPASLPNVSRVLTFKLGADGKLPQPDWQPRVVFNPPAQTGSEEVPAKGYALYQDICMGCHGLNAVSGLLIPDLRGSAYLRPAGWNAVVLGGALSGKRDGGVRPVARRGTGIGHSRLHHPAGLAWPEPAAADRETKLEGRNDEEIPAHQTRRTCQPDRDRHRDP